MKDFGLPFIVVLRPPKAFPSFSFSDEAATSDKPSIVYPGRANC
jgi:hypothetical protein